MSDFTNDQSVWTHPKRVLHQVGHIEPTILRRLACQLS